MEEYTGYMTGQKNLNFNTNGYAAWGTPMIISTTRGGDQTMALN